MNRDEVLARITGRVQKLLEGPVITLEASGRHIHVTREAVDALFGRGYKLTRVSDLSQPGQFVCAERLRLKGPKGEFSSVVILGPERKETQAEISATDALALGIKAPVRLSGNTEGTPGATLVGPAGEYEMPRGVIVAERHIHMTKTDAARWGFKDGQAVTVRVFGPRALVFNGVLLRVSEQFATYMHIDYDEANACGFTKGMQGVIVKD